MFVPAGIGGLSQDSVVLCEQLRVVDKSRIMRVIGHLDDNYLENLAIALCTILGLRITNNDDD
ncbi:MAG: type II toxin-antitoxin system PemK/MazF family toxin [Nostoc sp. CreGUA01]|nr:type II toxin-antitoxin system PemK/MazF family toxin [Nostoc sp. CreGUA01]